MEKLKINIRNCQEDASLEKKGFETVNTQKNIVNKIKEKSRQYFKNLGR